MNTENTDGGEIRARIGELARGKWNTAVRMVDTELICPNPFYAPEKNSDEEIRALAHSIESVGMQNPLTIRLIGTADEPLFQLVTGEKRLRACIYGGITPVPCVILGADPDKLTDTGDIPLPRNAFEEAEMIAEILAKSGVSMERMAKSLGITEEALGNKLCLLNFDRTERKLILKAKLSPESAAVLDKLLPQTKCEIYRAIANGVVGLNAEELITDAAAYQHTKVAIKDVRLFYNTVGKAVSIMNKSGISVKCDREERKTFTRLVITVPNST